MKGSRCTQRGPGNTWIGTCTKLYQTVEEAAAKAACSGEVEDITNRKIWKLARIRDFMLDDIRQVLQFVTFLAPDSRLLRQRAEMAVIRKARDSEHSSKQKQDDDQNRPLSPLPSRFKESSKTSNDRNEKREEIKLTSTKTFPYKKRISIREGSEDYNISGHKKSFHGVNVLNRVGIYFTEAMSFKTYRHPLQSQVYTRHKVGKNAKRTRRKKVQMKSAVSKLSDPFSFLYILSHSKISHNDNEIYGELLCFFHPLHERASRGCLIIRHEHSWRQPRPQRWKVQNVLSRCLLLSQS